MPAKVRPILARLVLAALCTPAFAADQPSPAEQKLRDSLRNTMLQMRTIQGERDAMQAEKEAAEAEKADLAAKLEKLTKDYEAQKVAAEKSSAEAQARITQHETDNAYLASNLEKQRATNRDITAAAQKVEAARAKLNSENIVLQRKVEDQQRKNLEMHRIGLEILDRYENFGLATALTAREPFIGTTKVKMQNLVQDYQDKLSEQRVKSDAPAPKATPAPNSKPASKPAPAKDPAPPGKASTPAPKPTTTTAKAARVS